MQNEDLAFASIVELVERLDRREVSAVEVARAQLVRIAAYDDQLNSYITVLHESAIAGAEAADRRRAGGDDAPLLGVPIALKDLFATKGIKTTAGSRVLADHVPDEDATVVARLREAGTVLLGKTNMMEFAYGYPHPDYGESRNPWGLNRTAGGSSGGSAAAVAAGLAYGALGSDTGGSIRSPATFCGLVGLKPTYGRVSRHGVTPLSWSLDHAGPLTRAVADTALIYDAIAGYDPGDPASASQPFEPTTPRLNDPVPNVQIGVVEAFFHGRLEPEVTRVSLAAVEVMRALGFNTVPVGLDCLDLVSAVIMPILQAEATSYHWPDLTSRPEEYSDETRANLHYGAIVLAKDYVDAQRIRRQMTDEVSALLNTYDALVFPTQPIVAPLLESYQLPESGEEDVLDAEIGYTGLANLTGHPAITVPCGFDENGLPVGIQFTGRAFDEGALLRIARQYEAATEWWLRHPDID